MQPHRKLGITSRTCIIACNLHNLRSLAIFFSFLLFFLLSLSSCAHYLSGAKSNHSFPLICPDGVSDLRNNSQFRQKIPVQPGVIWFFCSPEIYMYSAYQLDYWQVGRITQFEVTCFSRCSIQCHVALGGDGERSVERMLNFLAPSFPHDAAHSFACFQLSFLFAPIPFFSFSFCFGVTPPHGITKWPNVNVLQSDNGSKRYSLQCNTHRTFRCAFFLARQVIDASLRNGFTGTLTLSSLHWKGKLRLRQLFMLLRGSTGVEGMSSALMHITVVNSI